MAIERCALTQPDIDAYLASKELDEVIGVTCDSNDCFIARILQWKYKTIFATVVAGTAFVDGHAIDSDIPIHELYCEFDTFATAGHKFNTPVTKRQWLVYTGKLWPDAVHQSFLLAHTVIGQLIDAALNELFERAVIDTPPEVLEEFLSECEIERNPDVVNPVFRVAMHGWEMFARLVDEYAEVYFSQSLATGTCSDCGAAMSVSELYQHQGHMVCSYCQLQAQKAMV